MSKRNRLPHNRGPRPGAQPRPGGATPHRTQAGESGRRRGPGAEGESGGPYWLYGSHAVRAALANPQRHVERLLIAGDTADGRESLMQSVRGAGNPRGAPNVESVDRGDISRLLPEGAVHQGMAALVRPLPAAHLDEVCDRSEALERAVVVVLDQVTDPHNVGAILRSAAAFGALAVIVTERNAPPETGTLAKSASGALEHVPLVRVTNLARALDRLKQAGYWCAGLAADGSETLAKAGLQGRIALVLGSEGEGLRRLTRERCDLLVRLPTAGPIGHLNVSNAAAVALYEMVREDRDGAGPAADAAGTLDGSRSH